MINKDKDNDKGKDKDKDKDRDKDKDKETTPVATSLLFFLSVKSGWSVDHNSTMIYAEQFTLNSFFGRPGREGAQL